MRTILTSICVWVVMLTGVAMADEQPEYTVLARDGGVEIRQYAPMIVAEVTVNTSEGEASGAAFRPLFRYISGRNSGRSKIDMTAPVTQAPAGQGVKIDMTAPVTQAPRGEGAWTVAFVMPTSWTMETLPTPNDPRVVLRAVPGKTVASLRYSGRSRPRMQAKKRQELLAWMGENGYAPIGEPSMAFYNAPYVAGPFRRNEILIETIGPDQD